MFLRFCLLYIFKISPLRYHRTWYLFQSKKSFCSWDIFLYNWSLTSQLLFKGLSDASQMKMTFHFLPKSGISDFVSGEVWT